MIKLKCDRREFRVLNLTDTQLESREWAPDHVTGKIFKKTVQTLVERVKPDLITVSGDLSYAGDLESYKNFADYLDTFGVPWTCCFGNHDNQDGPEAVQRVVDEYVKHPLFLYEKCDPALGNCNNAILVEIGGKAATGILLMDTHDRATVILPDGGEPVDWDGLSAAQLNWYSDRVAELKAAGCNDSVLIIHTPIHAYAEAFAAAFSGDLAAAKAIRLADCNKPGVWNAGYEDSYGVNHEPITCYLGEDGVLERILQLGSTHHVLCGHNHVNNWRVNYKGVQLAFALKTGSGSYWEPELNGGTVLTVTESGITDIRHEFADVLEYL